MVSNIKVDFTLLKTILFKVIKEKMSLISADEKIVLQTLYEQYEPKNDIDDEHLEWYKKIFADFFANKCKSFAKYCSDDIINNEKGIYELEKSGKIFNANVFNALKKQLYLEMKLLDEKNQIAISIISKLSSYINNYYFEAESETLELLFFNAIMLYLSDSCCNELKDAKTISIVKSMKYLLCKCSLEFDILYGDIYFNEDSQKVIQLKIEN